ncbi:MAG TPA: hypothetical protein DCE41_37085 [Cytophagales bacterium]|nr:hypothetical protein [Cytophagales bacterium]
MSITLGADAKVEADETLTASLSNLTVPTVDASNIDITDDATVTITNDDAATLAIDDVSVTEGDDGTAALAFTVTLTGEVDQSVSVDFATADSTATTAGNDYVANSGTITFDGTDGETEAISVSANGDNTEEFNELLKVVLSNISAGGLNVSLSDATGIGTINDDDATDPGVTLSAGGIDSTSSDPIAVTVTFTEAVTGFTLTDVTLTGGTGSNLVTTDSITFTFDLSADADGTLTAAVAADAVDDLFGNGNTVSNTLTIVSDQTAPTGFTVSIDQAVITATNDDALSFTFAGAEVGTTYRYTITDEAAGSTTEASGTISTATDQITGVDVSSLTDGTLTLSVTLEDALGNVSTAQTDEVEMDRTGPTGFTVAFDPTAYDASNSNNVGFVISGGEADATYAYTISSSGGGDDLTGTGTMTSSDLTLTGLDGTGLGDGTLTLSVVLTDANNNVGGTQTATATKLTIPTATTDATTDITFNSATLNATVNAQGASMTVTFELADNDQFTDATTLTAAESPVTGATDVAVTAEAANLDFETTYFARVIVNNGTGGDIVGNTVSFTTEAVTEPTLTDLTGTVEEDGTLALSQAQFVGAFTLISGDPLNTVRISTLPSNGTLQVSGTTLSAGDVIDAPDLDGLAYVPNADYNGEDSFTWNAEGVGTFAASDANYTITVTPVNDAPTIAAISDREGEPDTPISGIVVSIGDVDGDLDGLTVSASSDNIIVIDQTLISFAGTGGDRTMTLTPANDGEAEITVTVSDGELTASTTFTLTVVSGEVIQPFIPNLFSPNDDGVNDTWEILNVELYDSFRIVAFDPDTKTVVYELSSGDAIEYWDGNLNGVPVEDGPYSYVMIFSQNGNTERVQGTVNLRRSLNR